MIKVTGFNGFSGIVIGFYDFGLVFGGNKVIRFEDFGLVFGGIKVIGFEGFGLVFGGGTIGFD